MGGPARPDWWLGPGWGLGIVGLGQSNDLHIIRPALYYTYNSFKSSLYYNKWRSASTMRKTNEINLRKQIRFSLKPEKPLTCSEQEDYPRLPIVLFFVGGGRGNAFLPLPFLIFDLVHMQFILLVSVQMNSCSPEQLLPSNWIADEDNSCYPNSSLPGNLWYRSIIFSACAPCLF